MIYHLSKIEAWNNAQQSGVYTGLDADRVDGFLHFSNAAQIQESAAKHRAGETDLVLLCVDEAALGPELVWEESRGGKLFPHLYGDLSISAVRETHRLALDPEGRHIFPPL